MIDDLADKIINRSTVNGPIQYSSLIEHFKELKKRVFYAALAYAVALCICGFFASHIFDFLVLPLTKLIDPSTHRMIYTNLMEGFLTRLQITLWSGFILAFPLIAAQLWIFIAPGLYSNEKKALIPFFVGGPILFLFGAALAYFAIIPLTWEFFLSFEKMATQSSLPIQFEGRIGEYLGFTLQFIMAFGMAFQMPLLLLLLARIGVITSVQLKKFRRFAIVIIFVAAAILTPSPDMFGQTAMAVPLIVLYEISIFMIRRVEKERKDNEQQIEIIDAPV